MSLRLGPMSMDKEPPRAALETSRLRLEPVAAAHALGLYQAALASRAQLLPWMPWARDITLEGIEYMIMREDEILGILDQQPVAAKKAS